MAWLGGIFSSFGDITGRIRDFIWSLFQSIIGWIQSGIDWLSSSLASLGRWTSEVITNIGDSIASLGAWAWNNIAHYYNEAVAFTQRSIGDLGSWASASIANLSNWVSRAVGDLTGFVNNIFPWVTDHVWRPLNDFITSVSNFTTNVVIPWVSNLVATAFGTLRLYVDALRGWAEGVMRTILDPIWPYIDMVRKSWDWLAYFATHPLTSIYNLVVDAIRIKSGDLTNALLEAFLSRGDEAEQIIARWIFGAMTIVAAPFIVASAFRSRLARMFRRR